MNVIFLGSPDFSATVLQSLILSKHKVVGVVTNHDKPAGRGHKMEATPVKILAQKHNIPVFQFAKIRLEGNVLKQLNADIMVTAAFGQILSQENIDITPNGILNVHASLLPKYRGSSPIQWSIIKGETITGITIMRTDVGIDTGDILLQESINIKPDETAGELFIRLADLGGKLIVKALDMIENKQAKFYPQNHSNMSYYPMLKKEDGNIDFNNTSKDIVNLVRGLNPWPVAYFFSNGEKIKVYSAKVVELNNPKYINMVPKSIISANSKNGLIIKTKDGAIRIEWLQAPNSKKLDDKSFLNGRKIEVID